MPERATKAVRLAEREVSRGRSRERGSASEGPNEEESSSAVLLGRVCIRSPMDWHRSAP